MDLSLDEIIQSKRNTNKPKQSTNVPIRRGRITKRNSAPFPMTRNWNNNNNNNNNAPNKTWQHDMFSGSRGNSGQQCKILISNLDYGVSNVDINELFKEFGQMLKAGVHFDRSGRSMGTAEVIYANKSSAIMARNKYNGIPLDDKPMKIVLAEQNSFNNALGDRLSNPRQMNVRRPPSNRPVFEVRPNRQRFEGRQNRPNFNNRNNNQQRNVGKKNNKSSKTKEELDAEMDDYLSKTD